MQNKYILSFEQEKELIDKIQKNKHKLSSIKKEMRTYKICLAAVQQNPRAIKHVPEKIMIDEILMEAVQKDGLVLQYINKDKRTAEICLAAVQENPKAIQYVPKKVMNEDIIMKTVQKDGRLLKYIPENKSTEKICLAAFQENPKAIKYFPELLINKDITIAAVQKNGLLLKYIPQDRCTEKICLAAFQENPTAIQYFPELLINKDIIIAAVQKNGLLLRYIPEGKCTAEICLLAVQQNPWAIEYVPEKIVIDEILMEAVQKDGRVLKVIPDEQLTEKICLAAVQENPKAIRYFPNNSMNENLIMKAVQKDGMLLQYIPKAKLTEEIYLAAVQQNPKAIQYVPDEVNNEQLSNILLKKVTENGLFLKHIPQAKRTEDICLAAVKQESLAIQFVPKEMRKEDIALTAVKNDGILLRHIPKDFRSKEICMAAVEHSGYAIKYIPEKFLNKEVYAFSLKNDPSCLKIVIYDMKISKEELIEMIQNLGIKHFLTEDIDLRNQMLSLVKDHPSLEEEWRTSIDKFISEINTIVVTNQMGLYDHEIADAYHAYSRKSKRIEHNKKIFTHVNQDGLEKFLEDWKSKTENKQKSMALILLDHAGSETKELAGMSINNISKVVQSNDMINEVILQGCSSVQSSPLEEELSMQKRYEKFLNEVNPNEYVFMAASPNFSEEKSKHFQKQLKEHKTVYLLKNKNKDGKYELICYFDSITDKQEETKKEDNKEENLSNKNLEVIENHLENKQSKLLEKNKKKFVLTPEQAKQLLEGIDKTKKIFPEISKKRPEAVNEVINTKLLKNTEKTEHSEQNKNSKGTKSPKKTTPPPNISLILSSKFDIHLFDNPKDYYPFLNSMSIPYPEGKEFHKLNSSLLKDLVKELGNSLSKSKSSRSVTIKGYANLLHVDTKSGRMIVSTSPIYTTSYKNTKKQGLPNKEENIDKTQLMKNRLNQLKNPGEKTSAKSIKVVINTPKLN